MTAFIFSEKMLLIIVTLVGMAICSSGIGQVAARGDWLHPLSIVGYLLGILILGIVGASLGGVQLPLIDSTRAAIIAIIVLMVAKVVLTQLHSAFA